MTHNKLTCLFGHHQYSEEVTRDKDGSYRHLCKICKRSGYYTFGIDDKVWYDYDEEGNLVHSKWNDGFETWRDYDKKGNCVHSKWNDGEEVWYDEKGNMVHFKPVGGKKVWLTNNGETWTSRKPKNWKYENV